MKKLLNKIKRFLKEGWHKFEIVNKPKTFFEYFIHFPLNWMWTLGSSGAILMFLEASKRYEAEIFLWLSAIPSILLIYNFVDEYFAFQYFKMHEYLKPLSGELDKDFKGTDAYWKRIQEFEIGHNIAVTKRHNGVIGRKVSGRTLQRIVNYSTGAVMLYIVIRVFITG